MIRSTLVQRIAGMRPHLYQGIVDNIVSAILDEIAEGLARGDRVELRRFGVFSIKHRQARTGRNPKTGEYMQIEQKRFPIFKASRAVHERLNRHECSVTGSSPSEVV
ncbi:MULTISPECIES: HU family DNA-binding protein [unclassified Bradyrhizobium]|nr:MULTISPECIES: HU family DNA-binding protein [unclassified Bradyrhizobium]WGR75018.1 HU family DNA-binding protein [Bradyrhizobium sp. ISRA426]WGR82917.1 HU family DNA-binding protein [Bradyrhizobium sp. ISRA430]WGR90215.1 HU family DNA-binding protein [Bradyrhizobium sp. ISRA432]